MTVKDAMAAQVEMYKRGGEGLTSAVDCQPFLFPRDLFLPGEEADGRVWTCARTRPRWEKKFAEWLRNRHQAHFLPVFRRVTISHRKRQISELPLFSGFVFVVGDLTKKDFAASDCVAYVLKPCGERAKVQLDRELRDVWRGLQSGLYVTPTQNLGRGETCRIVQGPLQGVEGRFERMGRFGRLLLQVEMMGGGIVVEVSADEVETVP